MKEGVAKGFIRASRLFAGLAMVIDSKTVVKEAEKSLGINRFMEIENPKAMPGSLSEELDALPPVQFIGGWGGYL